MSPGAFELETRRSAGRLVVRPSGELDIATVARVRDVLAERAAGEQVEIDLRGVRFLDTSGLQVVVEAHRRARDEGYALTIVRGTHAVQRVFEMAGLNQVLPFIDLPADG